MIVIVLVFAHFAVLYARLWRLLIWVLCWWWIYLSISFCSRHSTHKGTRNEELFLPYKAYRFAPLHKPVQACVGLFLRLTLRHSSLFTT